MTKAYQSLDYSTIESQIDEIVFNGVVEILNNDIKNKFVSQISASSVYKNILDPLEEFIFQKSSPEFKKKFNSNIGDLKMCSKFFKYGDSVFSCIQCASDPTCVMCEDCFLNSHHITHNYVVSECHLEGGCCDCGDDEAWTYEPTCKDHASIGTEALTYGEFKPRITSILKHLVKYFMKVGNYPISIPLSDYLTPTFSSNQPAKHKMFCILVLNDETHSIEDVVSNFSQSLHLSLDDCVNYTHNIDKYGLYCVYLHFDELECISKKNAIDKFVYNPEKEPIRTLLTNAEHLGHMHICSHIMKWVHHFVCKKTELCEIFAQIVFDQTDLLPHYIANEIHLWKTYRRKMIYKILTIVLYSDYGKIQLTKSYLKYCDQIYLNYITDSHKKTFFFLNLTVQFITCPSLVIYLIENNFLYKILDSLSGHLTRFGRFNALILGFMSNEQLFNLFDLNKINTSIISKIFYASDAISECLCNQLDPQEWSSDFKNGLLSGVSRLIDICIQFNNMAPIQRKTIEKENDKPYSEVINIIIHLHNIMMNMSKWIVLDVIHFLYIFQKTLGNSIVKILWDHFEKDFNKNFNIENQPHSEIIEKLITYKNVNTDIFSINDLPIRFFIGIYLHIN
ncbi:hypothetical protein HZS_6915 [Henneguya salminicola]|nr:hypothetical protein HZS_6915 [Henneguya salminicola]